MKYEQEIWRGNQGFTLVELLAGMAILVIVLGAILAVFGTSLKAQQYNFEASANIQDERQIIMKISDEVRDAVPIVKPAAGQTANSLEYQKKSDGGNRSIAIGTGTDANTILVKDPSGNIIQKLGIGRVDSLEFQRESATARKITIKLVLKNPSKANAPKNEITTDIYTLN